MITSCGTEPRSWTVHSTDGSECAVESVGVATGEEIVAFVLTCDRTLKQEAAFQMMRSVKAAFNNSQYKDVPVLMMFDGVRFEVKMIDTRHLGNT